MRDGCGGSRKAGARTPARPAQGALHALRKVIVLTSGQADVSIVFTMDVQIEREQLVLLDDDKGMFPAIQFRARHALRDAGARMRGARKVVAMVNAVLAAEAMQELDARVDLNEKTAEDVAGGYLSEPGMVQ